MSSEQDLLVQKVRPTQADKLAECVQRPHHSMAELVGSGMKDQVTCTVTEKKRRDQRLKSRLTEMRSLSEIF